MPAIDDFHRFLPYRLGRFNSSPPFGNRGEFVPRMSVTGGCHEGLQGRSGPAPLWGSEPAGSITCREVEYIQAGGSFWFRVARRIPLEGRRQ